MPTGTRKRVEHVKIKIRIMEQKDKELLLKDLCSRLPYKTIFNWKDGSFSGTSVISEYPIKPYNKCFNIGGVDIPIENIKLYLRPMSSMTEEELNHLWDLCDFGYAETDWDDYAHSGIEIIDGFNPSSLSRPQSFSPEAKINMVSIDYLNSIHVDYRGLIEKGLAIEVTEENNPYKELEL